jgi:cephalosporin hydroxylase
MPDLVGHLPSTDLDISACQATFNQLDGFTQDHAGLRMWKTVDDMERYRQIIEATSPEMIVETGTLWGGFAAWLADTFHVDVITVDVEHAEGRPETWPGVTFLVEGSSVDPQVVSHIRQLTEGRRTMVTLDSDHHAPHVRSEIRAYGPMVSPGCYLVVEDGIADLVDAAESSRWGPEVPDLGGPLRAITEILADSPVWERDLEVENLTTVSHNPAGWWRRKL